MNGKKWIRNWLMIIMILPTVGILNYVVDPYGSNNQFNFSFNQLKNGTTLRPLHYKLPIVAKGGIDNIMLGTSTMGVMKTEPISRYFGGNTFNLSSPSSLTDEQYYLLRYAVHFNKIKNVVYGLDFLSINGAVKTRESEFDELSGQIKAFKPITDTPLIYFSLDTLKQSIAVLSGVKGPIYFKDGRREYLDKTEKIAHGNFKLNYNPDFAFFRNRHPQYTPFTYSDEKLDYVKKIIELCQNNHINLVVYIPPHYSEHYAMVYSQLTNEYIKFKKELATLTDYIDFSGITPITTDKNNYVDFLHLRAELSDKIFDAIFSRKASDNHDSFSVLVADANETPKIIK